MSHWTWWQWILYVSATYAAMACLLLWFNHRFWSWIDRFDEATSRPGPRDESGGGDPPPPSNRFLPPKPPATHASFVAAVRDFPVGETVHPGA